MNLALETGALALLAALGACRTAPVAPVPAPLPEVLEWARGDAGEGAFLGLKVRENHAGGLDDLSFEPGARVVSVVENSPARAAGLRAGDVLLALDERPVDDPQGLEALLGAAEPGDEVELSVQRGDTVFKVPVALATAGGQGTSDARIEHRLDPARSRASWIAGRGGVVLVGSDDCAPFPRAGVPVGSTVLALDGRGVSSERALIRALQARPPGAQVEVSFRDPEGAERSTTVKLFQPERRLTAFVIPILTSYRGDVERSKVTFVLLDLYVISLFRYERRQAEREYRLLRFFRHASGVGELSQ